MGRPRKENLEDKPQVLETTVEDLKQEKPTESKTVKDFNGEVTDSENKKLEDITGIGEHTAEKLKDLGFTTITDLATSRPDEIASLMKVNYAIAKAWCMQAQEIVMSRTTLKNANEQDKEKKFSQLFIQMGSSDFNNMLGKGIPTQSITGLCGRLASGKTQICFEAIVDCLGRLNKKAVFIETEADTFHLDRLKEIAKGRNLECNWNDLYICEANQIPTAKAQFIQYKVVQKALENGEDIKLVVIDSFNAKFRAGWSRSEMLPIRSREIAEHINLMEYLMAKYNLAWLITCQVIAPPRPDQGLAMKVKFVDNYYPVGGDTLLHSVNNWIALTQIKSELWKAALFDSSYIKRSSCDFIITSKGIQNGVK